MSRQYSAEFGQQFWNRVDKRGSNDCWDWKDAKSGPGYGNVYLGGGRAAADYAGSHVVAYELTYGEVPVGTEVCHTCDHRPCCNPAHLWAGTRGQNVQDAHNKGRAWRGGANIPLRGEDNPMALLTAAQVEEIKGIDFSKRGSQTRAAEKYGVSLSTINSIHLSKCWR